MTTPISAILLIIAVHATLCHAQPTQNEEFIAGVNAVPATSADGNSRRRPPLVLHPPPRTSPAGTSNHGPTNGISETIGMHINGIYNTVRDGHSHSNSPGAGDRGNRPVIPNSVYVDVRVLPNVDDKTATEDQADYTPTAEEPANGVGEPDVGAGIIPEGANSAAGHTGGRAPAKNDVSDQGSHDGHGLVAGDHDHSNNNDQDGHHDHSHEHLDRMPNSVPLHQDLGGNIVPLDDDSLMRDHTHSDGTRHIHEGSSADGSLSRTDKSLGSEEMDLCDLCLCDSRHTHISCNSVRTGTKNLTLEAILIPATAITLKLKNFDLVTVLADTFATDTSLLQNIMFENIGMLQLKEHSLHFSRHSKENMLVTVQLINVAVPVLPSYALTQLDTNTRRARGHDELAPEKTRFITVKMYKCIIDEIESNALYRARLLYFNLTDVTINSMATKSFDLDVYEEWVVQDSKLPHLPTNAVCLHAEKSVVFSRNMIRELDSNAWAIEAGGQVLFEFNIVTKIRGNAFLNITPMKKSRSANIVFLNNTVISADEDALVTNDQYPRHERKVENNRFNLVCECNISIHFKEMMDINENDTLDLWTQEVVLRNSLCLPHFGSSQYMYISKFLDQECEPVPVLVIAITVAVVVLLLVSVTVAVVCAHRAKKAQEEISYLGETSSRSFSTINTHAGPQSPIACDHLAKNVFYDSEGNPQWIMAVPEVKTYQETEVHVNYEESQPIQSSARNSCQDYMIEMQRKTLIRQSCPFN